MNEWTMIYTAYEEGTGVLVFLPLVLYVERYSLDPKYVKTFPSLQEAVINYRDRTEPRFVEDPIASVRRDLANYISFI